MYTYITIEYCNQLYNISSISILENIVSNSPVLHLASDHPYCQLIHHRQQATPKALYVVQIPLSPILRGVRLALRSQLR